MASKEPEHEHREEDETPAGEDEDTGAQVAPIVKLEEVAVTTGEENEDAILDLYVQSLFLFISSISRSLISSVLISRVSMPIDCERGINLYIITFCFRPVVASIGNDDKSDKFSL